MLKHNTLTIAAVVVYDPNTGKEERILFADPKDGLGPNWGCLSQRLKAQTNAKLVYRWLPNFRKEAKKANGKALQLIARFPNTDTKAGREKVKNATPSPSRNKEAALAVS